LAELSEVNWQAQLAEWLDPFLDHLRHSSQKHWAPVYLWGLLGPGERKSIEPMADRLAPGASQQLHHFISASTWRPEPLELELVRKAQDLVGGADAVLAIDDTALVKQGSESVGVAHQYCGQLGKQANCQVLVSLTLARREVPVCVGLRPFLPETWARDMDRRLRAGVPLPVEFQPKWRIALEEIDRVRAAGAVFGCVAADAEYGKVAHFRAGLAERGLRYAVGIPSTQTVYRADVTLEPAPRSPTGRPAKHPVPRPARSGRRSTRCRPTPGASCRGAPAPRAGCGRASPPCGCASPTVHGCAPAGVCRARPPGWSVSSGPRTSAGII
jgi:SRSO17 transposase